MKLHRKLADILGYRLENKKDSNLFIDLHLERLLKQNKIEVVLDVGANVGQFGTLLRSIGFKGRIISFEPLPAAREKLMKKAVSDPLWDVKDYALGNEETELDLQDIGKEEGGSFSSFLKINEFAKKRFAERVTLHKSVKVKVKRLEDVWKDLELEGKAVHLKIDTQGFDYNVYQGARNVLLKINSLQTELIVKPIYSGMKLWYDFAAELEKDGFFLTGTFPVSRERNNLNMIEMDGFFVREV